jgi:hypothetical protein
MQGDAGNDAIVLKLEPIEFFPRSVSQ